MISLISSSPSDWRCTNQRNQTLKCFATDAWLSTARGFPTTKQSSSHFWSCCLMSIHGSISLSLSHTSLSPECCHPHISPCYCPIRCCLLSFLFPFLMLRCIPCLPVWIIHVLWGFRCGGGIRSLVWAVFLSAHLLELSRLQRLAERNTKWTPITHTGTVLSAHHPSISRNTYMYSLLSLCRLCVCMRIRMQIIMGHHHL